MKRWIRTSAARLVAMGVLASGLATVATGVVQTPAPVAAAPGDGIVTVRVVQEVNANGLVDSTIMEPPLAGVTVHLSDNAGNSILAVTNDAGIAVFTPAGSALVGGNYRVEADNPRPNFFYPGHAANGQGTPAVAKITAANLASPANAKLSTTTEFVTVAAGANAYVNMAFWYPPYYCQQNATMCTAVQPWDAPPGQVSAPTQKGLVSVPYRFTSSDSLLATKADTGTVYGIAYDRDNQRIFSSAYAKRGADYGDAGPGGIYVTDLSGGNTYPLTGVTEEFATIANAGTTAHTLTTFQDVGFMPTVGTESLGDIDITNDNRWLFGVNMFEKTVFVFDLTDDSLAGTYLIPNPCADPDDWRPMGTGEGLDTSYVGGVCATATMDDLTAHVFQFDPATGAFGPGVLDEPLDYGRGLSYRSGFLCNGSVEGGPIGRWFSWIDRWPSVSNEQRLAATGCGDDVWLAYPTPMLGDIIEETNGDLVISFRDRFGDQVGWNAYEQRANGSFATIGNPGAGGDVVRGCKLSNGTFVLDPNLALTDLLAPTALCTNNNLAINSTNGQPTTFREFYTGDHRAGFHDEAFFGGIALSRVETTITGTGYDMEPPNWTQGVGAMQRNGLYPVTASGTVTSDGTPSPGFGKGGGMADLEVLCDEAPIQIGNRVWIDTDADGVQDPGETPIGGATVNLYDELGVLVATTTTSPNGEYFFGPNNVPGGLQQDTNYVVRLDKPGDYAVAGPLYAMYATIPNTPGNDELDSDGVPGVGGYPTAAIRTGGAGVDDHSIDFGFVLPSVQVGDFVWVDTDRDGVQDSGELGIPGVVLTIRGPGGVPVTDVYGNAVGSVTTDSNGFYVFPSLPAGVAYTVTIDQLALSTITALAPYIPTQSGQGGAATDSSTWTATSVNLPDDGDEDMTLDFGFVTPSVQVGDYVWVDTDRDGVQDSGELGIEGVVLTITGPGGVAVTDVFGDPVGPVITDIDGFYVFPNLPAGVAYTVTIDQTDPSTITALAPYIPTQSGQGGTATDSSTWTATSVNLPDDGDEDMTLDFGFVTPSVQVGDYVWVDTDRDGVQDSGELGIEGVVLTITGPGGVPVIDVYGDPVTATTTLADGSYLFPNLPAGVAYTVTIDQTDLSTITALAPYIPTITGGGNTATDSSTWTATSANLPEDGDEDLTLDFGFVLPSVQVGDYVWVDTDRDGVQDPGELGIEGVVLVLTGPDGEPVKDVFGNEVGPVTTDSNGFYVFPDLPAGVAYTVTIDQLALSTVTALAPYVPTVAAAGDDRADDSSTWNSTSLNLPNDGDEDMTLDFGFVVPSVSIGDYVWLDTDHDGAQDPGEPGIGGVTLVVTGPGGDPVLDVYGNPVTSVTTAADGSYLFPNLPALPEGQSYTVTVSTPPASPVQLEGSVNPIPYSTLQPTTPGTGGDPALDSSTGSATSGDLTTDGATDRTLDFGYVLPSVQVGNFVWVDTDRDGLQEPGELGIAGVVLVLTGPGGAAVVDVFGNPVGPVTTDANGHYLFPNLPVGVAYTVTIDQAASAVALAPYIPTLPGVGNSAGDSSTGTATSLVLSNDGDQDLTLDFGFVRPSVSVADFVWVDTDRDGVQEPGEPGIPGVVLVLTGPDGVAVVDVFGNPVGPVATDANGHYLFPNLPAGVAYTVTINQAASAAALAPYLPTTAGVGDRAGDSSTGSATSRVLPNDGDQDLTLDFGFYPNPPFGGQLPATGASTGGTLELTLGLLVIGLALAMLGRRRRTA